MNDSQINVKIAVVIPCYKVTEHIEKVVTKIPEFVSKIYIIDDACPNKSGEHVKQNIKDTRIHILTHEKNKGVGGALVTGYIQALKDKNDIVVKIDGDGQMDPQQIPRFIAPILEGRADYTKGNRFYNIEDVRSMPLLRILGNAGLSFMTKLSSGYWSLFDPTNGYTAIHSSALLQIPLSKISNNFFFESDMLFRLNIARAMIEDIPMTSHYDNEESNLKINKIVLPFMIGHFKNFGKRIFYSYFLRDFNLASVEFLLGLPLMIFGIVFGFMQWNSSSASGIEASAGTVMLSALPIIIGLQLLLSFLQYDIATTPRTPLHKKMMGTI